MKAFRSFNLPPSQCSSLAHCYPAYFLILEPGCSIFSDSFWCSLGHFYRSLDHLLPALVQNLKGSMMLLFSWHCLECSWFVTFLIFIFLILFSENESTAYLKRTIPLLQISFSPPCSYSHFLLIASFICCKETRKRNTLCPLNQLFWKQDSLAFNSLIILLHRSQVSAFSVMLTFVLAQVPNC